MTISSRPMMIITLTLALAGAVAAQETSSAPVQTKTTSTSAAQGTPATTTTVVTTDASAKPVPEAEESSEARLKVRQQFSGLLQRHPDELTRVLVLDPTLLGNEPFLAKYPELAQFLTDHPEIRRNPHYYLQAFEYERRPPRQHSAAEDFAQMFGVTFVAALIAFALMWLVRTIVEQKRWSQLSRKQSEVHGRILDRLGSSEELLAYMKTPAGTKYLESAPIALHAAPAKESGALARVMWSIQIGVVVAAGGLGLLLVGVRSSGDAAQGFFAMGAVAFCVGGGFIASALVSLFVARRFGLSQENGGAAPGSVADDGGTVR